MLRKNVLSLTLHGLSFRLEAGFEPFIPYARLHLAGLFQAGEAGLKEPELNVRLHWNASPPETWKKPAVHQWGRRLFQSGPRLLLAELLYMPGLQVEAEWSGGCLQLDAYYRPVSRTARLSQGVGLGLERLYNALIYSLVYFPCIYVLEQTRGWHVLHAAAVSRPEGAWLLAGLPGSGKSTFSLGLLEDPGARLLSDNLLLFDPAQVYALPESIHLSPASQALLPPAVKDLLLDNQRSFSYGRQDYHLVPERRAWQASPQALFFLGLAGAPDCQPVPPAAALERLWAFDQQAKEISAYAQFASALDLVAPQPGHSARKYAVLEKLLAPLSCYEQWVERRRTEDK